MDSINFVSSFDKIKTPIQIITLQDSFFIYIGNGNFNFDNLTIGIYNQEVKKYNFNTNVSQGNLTQQQYTMKNLVKLAGICQLN
jgi:hypothetical protein